MRRNRHGRFARGWLIHQCGSISRWHHYGKGSRWHPLGSRRRVLTSQPERVASSVWATCQCEDTGWALALGVSEWDRVKKLRPFLPYSGGS